jgi:tetratricopeptide (TPR) repeat protein
LVAQEKLAEANRLVDEVLSRTPEAADMWELQAGIYARMDKPKLAAVNYEIVRKLGKATPATLFSLGDIYMAQESRDLALPVYLDAIRQSGATDVPRGLRAAKIMVSRGAKDEAKELFTKLREAAGGKLKSEDELDLLKLESKVALAEGDNETAASILTKVVERNPLDGEALIMIGDHFLKGADAQDEQGKVDFLARAEHRFDLASKIDGFEADAFVKLAQVRVKQEKFDDAIALLNQAQKLQPRDSVARYLEAIERLRRTAGA